MTEFLVRPGYGMPHSAYRYQCGCRCLSCTTAWQDHLIAEQHKAKRAKSTAPHGTAERAAGGCRCVTCHHARRGETATTGRPA